MRCYRDKLFAQITVYRKWPSKWTHVYACIIYTHRSIIQKVLGGKYILAPEPWRVLGRKSLLLVWSRRLWFRVTRLSRTEANSVKKISGGVIEPGRYTVNTVKDPRGVAILRHKASKEVISISSVIREKRRVDRR